MTEDPEVAAMSSVAEALTDLDDGARTRVIEWAAKRYGVILAAPSRNPTLSTQGGGGSDPSNGQTEGYDEFVDLFDAASPSSEADRALVGAFWFQQVKSQPSFDSQQVNNALKDVGHGVGNITQALTSLQNRKPALVRQMAKSGKTRQARKTYKLTSAGITAVKQMLSQAGDGDEE
jgi:hypothetical protein